MTRPVVMHEGQEIWAWVDVRHEESGDLIHGEAGIAWVDLTNRRYRLFTWIKGRRVPGEVVSDVPFKVVARGWPSGPTVDKVAAADAVFADQLCNGVATIADFRAAIERSQVQP
jgi:hypothetical protein